ncbi:hypothetical protein LTR56_025405 [Elasticomyces elasticus]|nr:hypothetical protein LTR56_025405 [Elasticomyces elasticus]KAK3662583.1 hypothetical protein LTR22_006649 [Elasticomyces elasticus]KAK4927927.1 hypothetical protein LTR49_005349 [Elasticomyces elasticus]KAK5756068.1 hypothetical protein LTS12_013858 [Elasticomyces elasticus]
MAIADNPADLPAQIKKSIRLRNDNTGRYIIVGWVKMAPGATYRQRLLYYAYEANDVDVSHGVLVFLSKDGLCAVGKSSDRDATNSGDCKDFLGCLEFTGRYAAHLYGSTLQLWNRMRADWEKAFDTTGGEQGLVADYLVNDEGGFDYIGAIDSDEGGEEEG